MYREVFLSGWEEHELFSSLYGLWWVLHLFLFGSSLLISSLFRVYWSILSWSLRGCFSGQLFSLNSSLWYSALWTLAPQPQLWPLNSKRYRSLLGFLLLCYGLTVSPHTQLRVVIRLFSFVFFLSGVTILHWCPKSENCFIYFSLLSSLRYESKSSFSSSWDLKELSPKHCSYECSTVQSIVNFDIYQLLYLEFTSQL